MSFLRLGGKWLNMALVSDVWEVGQTEMEVFFAFAHDTDHQQYSLLLRGEDVDKIRAWLNQNSEESVTR